MSILSIAYASVSMKFRSGTALWKIFEKSLSIGVYIDAVKIVQSALTITSKIRGEQFKSNLTNVTQEFELNIIPS